MKSTKWTWNKVYSKFASDIEQELDSETKLIRILTNVLNYVEKTRWCKYKNKDE